MSWALAIPAVVSLVSAAAQWYNSNKAQNASAEERAKVKSMLDKIQDPEFDVSMISPEELRTVGQYVPNAIPLIQEAAPQLIKAQGQGAMAGRGAQMEALQQYRQLAQSGRDPIAAMQEAQAARQAAAEASAARRSGTMEAARRGFGYSPMMNVGAGQDAQQRLALAGQQAAADAANRRVAAMGNAASLGGQLYNQDTSMEQANANIINDFNRRIAQNAQNIAGQNVANTNEALQRNLNERQRISDANILARNQARVAAQQNRNTYGQQGFNNALSKVNTYSGQAQQAQTANTEAAKQQNTALQSLSDLVMKGAAYYDQPDKKDKMVRG